MGTVGGRAPTGTDDLVIVDASGRNWRFNFLEWEASRPEEGGGLTINIVNLLDEIAVAISGGSGAAEGGGRFKQVLGGRPSPHEHQSGGSAHCLPELAKFRCLYLRDIVTTAVPYSRLEQMV